MQELLCAARRAKRCYSLCNGLGHSVEGADSALVDKDEIVEFVSNVTVGNESGDELDSAVIKLRLTSQNGYGVDVVLAGDDIDADVLDGPFLVVGGEVVDVGGLVADAALFLVT